MSVLQIKSGSGILLKSPHKSKVSLSCSNTLFQYYFIDKIHSNRKITREFFLCHTRNAYLRILCFVFDWCKKNLLDNDTKVRWKNENKKKTHLKIDLIRRFLLCAAVCTLIWSIQISPFTLACNSIVYFSEESDICTQFVSTQSTMRVYWFWNCVCHSICRYDRQNWSSVSQSLQICTNKNMEKRKRKNW